LAWAPGLAFCLAIFGFNLFGEGLRRFLQSGFVSLSRVLNRYTAVALLAAVVGLGLLLQAASPLKTYHDAAHLFDSQRALGHVQLLSSPDMQGRETGRPGAALAAEYIAMEMAGIGLQRGYQGKSYFVVVPSPRPHLDLLPELAILDAQGGTLQSMVYHQDFAEAAMDMTMVGEVEAPVVGVNLGALPSEDVANPYGLDHSDLEEMIAIIHPSDLAAVSPAAAGLLLVADDPVDVTKRYLMSSRPILNFTSVPVMVISRDTADALLRTAGSTLEQWESADQGLQPGQTVRTEPGARVRMSIPVTQAAYDSEEYYSEPYIGLIGYLPGSGAESGMDSQVVMVTAYYDGLGIGPDGTLYPGANDNASGVAVLLELARAMKASPYPPERTVVFVAWPGGERSEGLSVDAIRNAIGFSGLTIDSIVELAGLGQGSGRGLSLGAYSSYRMVRLFQRAASSLGVATTTRGRDPHFGLPIGYGFGNRPGPTLYLSWDGSDALAHTPQDTFESIDPEKLRQSGETALLSLLVLSRETNY